MSSPTATDDAPEADPDERLSVWGRYRRRRFRRRSIFWRWRRLLFLLMLVVVAALAGVGLILSSIELPPQSDRLDETSFLCTREVTERCAPNNAAAQLRGEENRVVIPYRRMPRVLINAVIAAEDQNFWNHNGVDPAGIARAGWAQVSGTSVAQQGGSTITQQYVKTAFLTDERTIARKIREAIYALELERELSKQEILERYLNTVYFGRGAYGVQAAAQAYFFKDVDELSLTDAAYLAGLIRAPESADASREPEEAYRRRDTTLVNMLELGYINQAAVRRGRRRRVGVQPLRHLPAGVPAGQHPAPDPGRPLLPGAGPRHRLGVLLRDRPPAAGRHLRRGPGLRRRPAGVHDAGPELAAPGLRDGGQQLPLGCADVVDRGHRGRWAGAGDDGRSATSTSRS